jgi:hypothetical protein
MPLNVIFGCTRGDTLTEAQRHRVSVPLSRPRPRDSVFVFKRNHGLRQGARSMRLSTWAAALCLFEAEIRHSPEWHLLRCPSPRATFQWGTIDFSPWRCNRFTVATLFIVAAAAAGGCADSSVSPTEVGCEVSMGSPPTVDRRWWTSQLQPHCQGGLCVASLDHSDLDFGVVAFVRGRATPASRSALPATRAPVRATAPSRSTSSRCSCHNSHLRRQQRRHRQGRHHQRRRRHHHQHRRPNAAIATCVHLLRLRPPTRMLAPPRRREPLP